MWRNQFTAVALGLVLAIGAGLAAPGQEPTNDQSLEAAAKRVQDATSTVRISCTKKNAANGTKDPDLSDSKGLDPRTGTRKGEERSVSGSPASEHSSKECRRPCSVVVCTGVCVAANKIVTAVPVSSDSKIRLTFPGGTQDDARLRVVDEFSGLVLLDSPNCTAKPLDLAAELPAAGSTTVTAAAWGVEKPLVFHGMVSGTGHTLAGLCYPPLLVCQLPTTDTSSGAAVVNRQGKLLGIVVGADPTHSHGGWMTYAIPVSHVQRLLRACEESDKQGHRETVIVLKRRRPKVGWVLESEDDAIVVKRITSDGPAEKAGIQKGDRVLAVDGIQIRSIYQAWGPTMCKQAGDTLTYRIQRGERALDAVVVLGGAVEMESLPAEKLSEIVQPKLEFGRDENGLYYFKPYRSTPGERKSPEAEMQERLERLERENQALHAEKEALLKERAASQTKSP